MNTNKTLIALGVAALLPFNASANDEAWLSDTIVTSENCTELSYSDTAEFMQEYYVPTLAYLPKADDIQEQFFKTYVMSSAVTLRSQLCLAEALEMKDLVAELKKEQAVIESGTSFGTNELEKQRAFTAKADEAIRAAAEEIDAIKPEQQKAFSMGVATYLAGAYSTVQMVKTVDEVAAKAADDAKEAAEKLKDAKRNPFGAAKGLFGKKDKGSNPAAVVTFFTDLLPGVKDQAVRVYDTGGYLMEFSKEKGIELPADATENLSAGIPW